MRFYIDTCVWIDFIEDRTEDDFLLKCLREKHIVLISKFLLEELLAHINPSDLRIILILLESYGILSRITSSEAQDSSALTLSRERDVPRGDALHAILARDNDAILITRDKHFLSLKDICRIRLL